MSYYFQTCDYQRNHYVFAEGQPSTDIFVVVEGDFVLTKKFEGRHGKGEIAILGPGEIIFDDKEEEFRTQSCVCTTQTG